MMLISKVLNKLSKSMIGYLPIKILEGIIGIITLKVYTSLFMREVYGVYTIISPSISIAFIISLGWIVQSVVRFSNTYEKDKKMKSSFFSTLFFTWLLIVVLLLIGFIAAHSIWPSVLGNPSINFKFLIGFVFLSFSVNQIMLAFLLYSNQRLLNSILILLAATLKLGLTYLMTRFLGNSIIAIFISQSVIDMCVGLVAVMLSKNRPKIRLKDYSLSMLKKLFLFGYPLVGMGLTFAILNMSDRYIIEYFYDEKDVGLYVSNYSVSSAAFTTLMMGLSRGIYPKMLDALNKKDHQGVEKVLTSGGKYYILLGLPAALGLTLLSKPLASIALGKDYFEGYPVIGIVAFAMFFFGLSEYANKGWELTANTFPIFINGCIAAVSNIVLNIIFIPIMGYIFAAYSTLLSFMIYYVVSWMRENKAIKFRLPKKNIMNILISSAIMSIIVLVFDCFILINLSNLFIVIVLAMIGYFASLFVLGELKEIKKLV